MAARDLPSVSVGLALILTALLAGCASGGPEPDDSAPPAIPPQTVTPSGPSPPEPGVEEPVAIPPKRSEVVVIDDGRDTRSERSLVEAAADERRRRQTAPESVVTVNDKNLHEHATGLLTHSTPGTSDPPGGEAGEEDRTLGEAEDREAYWRDRVREHREAWAATVDEILDLEQEVSELRLRFYAEDDPYVRDGRIKPQWDRALDELGEAQRRGERLEDEMGRILDEGRRAGALPGWLREGYDLEPSERPYGEHLDREADEEIVGEPVIVNENPD